MPFKYTIRNFSEESFYHIFNRGVEKRLIFLDSNDYQAFLYYLFIYLAPLKEVLTTFPNLPTRLQQKNLNSQVSLVCYCLMPNHFHFLVKEIRLGATSKFIKQITNAYTFYFNQKYDRVGSLVQGPFRAALIETDELLIHVSRYIHINPLIANLTKDLKSYPWSSYKGYINNQASSLYDKSVILNFFSNTSKYEEFVNDQIDYAQKLKSIKHLTIDD